MNKFNRAIVKEIPFNGTVNELIEWLNVQLNHLRLSDLGECDHKPSNLVVSATGDMANRAQATFCRYCGIELVPEAKTIIVWAPKPMTSDKLPTPPEPGPV